MDSPIRMSSSRLRGLGSSRLSGSVKMSGSGSGGQRTTVRGLKGAFSAVRSVTTGFGSDSEEGSSEAASTAPRAGPELGRRTGGRTDGDDGVVDDEHVEAADTISRMRETSESTVPLCCLKHATEQLKTIAINQVLYVKITSTLTIGSDKRDTCISMGCPHRLHTYGLLGLSLA